MKSERLGNLSLTISLFPLTLFIIRHLKIGMSGPWPRIILIIYTLIIIIGFVFAISLVKNPKTRNSPAKIALLLDSLYIAFLSFFIYLTIASTI